ncbi:MAG: MFS transporter [Robiginitomaculum sp.]|nr:MAG: MFS transporter [Robiginitomaculum sp.]
MPTSKAPSSTSSGYRTLVLGTLTVIYTFSFVDRLVFSILQEDIKADLGLSDLQVGMVSGLAFALFYALMGLPIAWAADRYNRVNIITASLALWSVFTVACGAAGSFWQLFLARVGVGFGEAGCTPPSHSLLSDYYQPEERAGALAIYSLGIPIGALIGLVAGGWLVQTFNWQTAFLVVGLPGVFVAIIARMWLKEPKRGQLEKMPVKSMAMAEVIGELRGKTTFWWIAFASSVLSFGGYALNAWMVPHFERTFELSKIEVAISFGMAGLIPTMLGTYFGGWITDRLGRRDIRWYGWVPAIAALVMGPTFFLALQMTRIEFLLMIWLVPAFAAGVWFAPASAMVQNIVAPGMRAIAVAVSLFISNMIGLGLGPMMTGAISAHLTLPDGSNQAAALQSALSIIVWIYPIGAIFYFLAMRTLPRDWIKE